MASVKGPLSPHLGIYKWQITMLLSITHRATGIFLSLGLLLLTYWLLTLASGPEAYAQATTHINAWYGQIILFLFSFSLYFHLCNGIRHLFWDAGLGFEIKTFYSSGYAVIAASVVLTLVTWLAGGGL
ncbi:MAG: succinate dehydrogenase, cytochrome b556 subunit [Gammaproteobacteria bacterium]